jgi:hypothetical protein
MHRLAIALSLLVGCGSPRFTPPQLPPLVTAAPARPAAPLVLQLAAGEAWAWDVQLGGVSIGRAELVVGDREVHSRFKTSKLASKFAKVRTDDVTVLDRASGRPVSAREQLDVDGDHDDRATSYATSDHHTVHTALGWVRAWASADATPATLAVDHLGVTFTLEVARPVPERLADTAALRIDGVVRGAPRPVTVTMWLSDDARRRPLRVAIAAGNLHVVAQLVDE